MSDPANDGYPARFAFLLLGNFTLISMSSAVEPLRMANRITRQPHFSWRTLSQDGGAVTASDQLSVNVDAGIHDAGALDDVDAVIVCGGARVEDHTSEPVLKWLRKVAKNGTGLGATCTGSYVLAKAGVLDGYRCSIHWENIAALADMFRNVQVSRSVFTIDRNRYTCSGGTSPVDMMLFFIADRCGVDVAAGVAEQFIHDRVRQSDEQQRIPLRHLVGRQSEKLIVAAELMEANIREPISQEELATYVGLSRRQLQRLFQRYLNCTPSRYYVQTRLRRARELLQQTRLSLVEISSLTGFVSSSHFSKSYKEHFGHSPSSERRTASPAEALRR